MKPSNIIFLFILKFHPYSPERSWAPFVRRALLFGFILLFCSPDYIFAASGLTRGRFRLRPALQVKETFTDNIYLSEDNRTKEVVTTLSPWLAIDFALAPRNYISFLYQKDLGIYKETDNIKKDSNRFGLSLELEGAKGSTVNAGISSLSDSIQPYSDLEKTKYYNEWTGYADSLLKVGSFTDLHLHYSHSSRQYDDLEYEQDEYIADSATVGLSWKKFSSAAILVEYDISRQDFHDISYPSTDFMSHAGLIGLRWDVSSRINGALKIGYSYVDFKELEAFGGIIADTNLTYKFSDKTDLGLVVSRSVQRSITALRETSNYYVSTGGSASLIHDWTSSLGTSLDFAYTNYDFDRTRTEPYRKDDNYRFGIENSYNFSSWLSISLSYVHRLNDSNLEAVNYRENAFHFTVSIFPEFQEEGIGGL